MALAGGPVAAYDGMRQARVVGYRPGVMPAAAAGGETDPAGPRGPTGRRCPQFAGQTPRPGAGGSPSLVPPSPLRGGHSHDRAVAVEAAAA